MEARIANMKYFLISFLITALLINLVGVLIAQNPSNTQPTGNITNSPQESQKPLFGLKDIRKNQY